VPPEIRRPSPAGGVTCGRPRLFRKLTPSTPASVSPAVQADVKTLKGFFETVLTESYWDAHRDRIMKEAVTARPLYDRFGREL